MMTTGKQRLKRALWTVNAIAGGGAFVSMMHGSETAALALIFASVSLYFVSKAVELANADQPRQE